MKRKAKAVKRPGVLDVIAQNAMQDNRDASSAEIMRRQAALQFQIGLAESAIAEASANLAELRATKLKQEAALTGLSALLLKR